jgi:hypothetical protein
MGTRKTRTVRSDGALDQTASGTNLMACSAATAHQTHE